MKHLEMAIARLQFRKQSLIKCMQSYLPFITLLKDQGRAIVDIIFPSQSSNTTLKNMYINFEVHMLASIEVQNDIFKLGEVNIAIKSKCLHQVELTRKYDWYENHKILTNDTKIWHELEWTLMIHISE